MLTGGENPGKDDGGGGRKSSKERGLPAGELVRDSLKRYLAVERFRALRGKVLPFAEAQGFLADEDVFKAIS